MITGLVVGPLLSCQTRTRSDTTDRSFLPSTHPPPKVGYTYGATYLFVYVYLYTYVYVYEYSCVVYEKKNCEVPAKVTHFLA